MNVTAFHVAPEEVMALLDGELSTSEASSVSSHLDECTECSQIAQRLRAASRSLATWTVAEVPNAIENLVKQAAKDGHRVGKPGLFIRASFWSWKRHALMAGGAISVFAVAVAILTPNLMRPKSTFSGFIDPQSAHLHEYDRYRGGGGGGDRDKLQRDGSSMGAMLGRPPANGMQDVLKEDTEASAPMIARTVSLSVLVKDFATSRSALDMILARYHGYSAELSVNTTENAPRSLQASLRIPAPALPSALNDLKKLGRVEKETQSGEEVTRQHEDLLARLRNCRDTEQRLRQMLQQRTGKITDVLKVEEEIARVRGEIEEMETEQQSIEHRVNFASVELQLAEEYMAQLNPPAPSISTRFRNALIAGYQNVSETVLDILLFFTEYGPVIVLWVAMLAAPVLLLWRRYRRIRAAT